MTVYRLTPWLVKKLEPLAELPRTPRGVVRQLAERTGYHPKSLLNYVQERRLELADERNGAEGGPRDAPPAPVPRGAPSAAAPGSGHLGVSSLHSAPAVHDPRAVVPPAGALPPDGSASEGSAPAGSFSPPAAAPPARELHIDSPGLAWARAAYEKGMSVDQVLRKGGDRLTWRDRDILRIGRGEPCGRRREAAA